MEKNKVIVFDCDGTILDTFNLIEHIVFETFKIVNPSYPLSKEEAHSFFGPYINDTFKKFAKSSDELNLYINTYNHLAETLTKKYIKKYDGITESLEALKKMGYKLIVASNKISKEVSRGLKICMLDNLIDEVIGAEKMNHPKPDPDCINQVKEKYHVENLIMVGDSYNDIKAGKNAGVITCGVTWCKTTKDEFIKWSTDYILDNPLELIELGEKYEHRL